MFIIEVVVELCWGSIILSGVSMFWPLARSLNMKLLQISLMIQSTGVAPTQLSGYANWAQVFRHAYCPPHTRHWLLQEATDHLSRIYIKEISWCLWRGTLNIAHKITFTCFQVSLNVVRETVYLQKNKMYVSCTRQISKDKNQAIAGKYLFLFAQIWRFQP